MGLIVCEQVFGAGMKPAPNGDGSGQQVIAGRRQREGTAAAVFRIGRNRDKSALLQRLEDCGNRRAIPAETFGDRSDPPRGGPSKKHEELKLSVGQVERS